MIIPLLKEKESLASPFRPSPGTNLRAEAKRLAEEYRALRARRQNSLRVNTIPSLRRLKYARMCILAIVEGM